METQSCIETISDFEIEIPKKYRLRWTISPSIKAFISAFMVALSTSLFALQYRMYPWLPPSQTMAYRNFSTLFLTLPSWISSTRLNRGNVRQLLKGKLLLYLFCKGLIQCVAAAFYNFSLSKIPSSLVQIILGLSPLLTLFLSRIFTKETVTVLKLIAFVIVVGGVICTGFLQKSPFETEKEGYWDLIVGILFAFGTVIIGSTQYILAKKICSVNVTSVLVSDNLIGVIISIILMTFDTVIIPPCGIPAFLILCSSTTHIITHLFFFYACKFGDPGVASALICGFSILIAFVFDVIFFGLIPPVLLYVGAILVLIGTCLNGFGKYLPRVHFLNRKL